MKMKNKWPLIAAALIMLALTWSGSDFSALRQLSASDLVPVLLITAAVFLLKTGVLSVVLIGVKKLWERISKSKRKDDLP